MHSLLVHDEGGIHNNVLLEGLIWSPVVSPLHLGDNLLLLLVSSIKATDSRSLESVSAAILAQAMLAQAISVQGHLAGLLWMGRNRKWVLEDSLQDAVWKTIWRLPGPPSVRWEKPRNQSASVTHQPGAKRYKGSNVKTKRKKKKKNATGCAPTTGVHHTGRSTGCSPPSCWEIGSNSHNVGGRRRDCCSHPGSFDESPGPVAGTAIPGTCRVHEEVLERQQKRVEQARASAAKAKEALAEAVGRQEKEESLLADGEERLSQLRAAA